MASRIEDYALIADCQSVALVAKDGSIDWLCVPRFDSGACYAALLGDPKNGRWQSGPASPTRAIERPYRPGRWFSRRITRRTRGSVTVVDAHRGHRSPARAFATRPHT